MRLIESNKKMEIKEVFENKIKELFRGYRLDVIVYSKSNFLQIEFDRKISNCYFCFKKKENEMRYSISKCRGKFGIRLEDDISEYLEYCKKVIAFLENKENIKNISDLLISYTNELKKISITEWKLQNV